MGEFSSVNVGVPIDLGRETEESSPRQQSPRQQWMAVFAKTQSTRLEEASKTLGDLPEYEFVRAPETGLIMVQGRAGGDGQPFNLGEMTVTRTAVRLCDTELGREIGMSYIAGRDQRKATLAAILDALLQNPDRQHALHNAIVRPLQEELIAARAAHAQASDATKVDFFTLVRGERE